MSVSSNTSISKHHSMPGKNLQTGPAYMASLKEQDENARMRAARKPKLHSKNLQTGPAYTASLREQETIRQYRDNNARRNGPSSCTVITYGHSQLKTGHPVRSAIHKQLNGRLVLRWVTTWESLL
ncbi:hypothetical protein KCU65_g3050, partial [Aureobasidium melanogenum]